MDWATFVGTAWHQAMLAMLLLFIAHRRNMGRPTGACSYAFLCFDQFDEGDRYSIRVDQLALFLLAAQEQRLAALEGVA